MTVFRPVLMLALMSICAGAQSANFCVNDGSQLDLALYDASGNGQDDDIRITGGTKTFAVPEGTATVWGYLQRTAVDADKDLTISGGWNGNCTTMSPGAQHTVLDGLRQDSHVLSITRHPLYFVELRGTYTIRNLTITGAGDSGGNKAIRALVASDDTTALIVLDRVQVRASYGGIALYGGRQDVSGVLINGVYGGDDYLEMLPSRGGSRVVYSTIYGNVASRFANDICPLRAIGVKTVANNVAYGHIDEDGLPVRDACLIAANFEPSPQNWNNHFRWANFNFLYTVDMDGYTSGVPAVEAVTIAGNPVDQPRFGTLQNTSRQLSTTPTYDVFGRPRVAHGWADRGAVESSYCQAPVLPAIQDLRIDVLAANGDPHPVGTVVGQLAAQSFGGTVFRILTGNTNGVFSINTAGELRLADPIELGGQAAYTMAIELEDACGTVGGSVRVDVVADALFASGFE